MRLSKTLAASVVGGVGGKALEIVLGLQEEIEDLLLVLRALDGVVGLRRRLRLAIRPTGVPLGIGPIWMPLSLKSQSEGAGERAAEALEEVGEIAVGYAEIAGVGGAVDGAGDFVAEHGVHLTLFRPEELLDGVLEGVQAGFDGGAGVELAEAVVEEEGRAWTRR